ncbi:PIN domain-containing protein [Nocardia sp. SYP-A9097]|uniref:PIN domain nuclease n=1 Tax=Nocardia sp. SYP-A9097 TaxID=2663237 RepID=UPI00129A2FC3|nr:PIN domain nuclease [Nocardia sp. SYP-A9097]MRH86522.1 PIN domain-containing protein [Nocardia sp. SYP-A9097]
MSTESYLIDKSALARWGKPTVAPILDELSARGLLAICGVVKYEVLFSVRRTSELERVRQLLRGFDWLPMPDEVWDRVNEVQIQLIRAGNHRAVSLPDLTVAAVAERHRRTVLHYDGDFDMIAKVTGQSVRWVVAAGQAD